MVNITTYQSKKKQNEKLIAQLAPKQQDYWRQFLDDTDRQEESQARRIRRYQTSLECHTSPLGLELLTLISDSSPTPLEALIKKEEANLFNLSLALLREILASLPPLDRDLLLLYYSSDTPPSWRAIGRELGIDYRRAQRRLPKVLKIVTGEVAEKFIKTDR